jgi:hypothetical protein
MRNFEMFERWIGSESFDGTREAAENLANEFNKNVDYLFDAESPEATWSPDDEYLDADDVIEYFEQ